MVRYPYMLEMWYEEDATLNHDGSFTEGAAEWRTVCPCNARQNGQAKQVRGANGEAFLYSFEIVMQPQVNPIPIGTKVRVYNREGFNIFDNMLCSNQRPSENDGSSYSVKGFYKSGQRNECSKLWL